MVDALDKFELVDKFEVFFLILYFFLFSKYINIKYDECILYFKIFFNIFLK